MKHNAYDAARSHFARNAKYQTTYENNRRRNPRRKGIDQRTIQRTINSESQSENLVPRGETSAFAFFTADLSIF